LRPSGEEDSAALTELGYVALMVAMGTMVRPAPGLIFLRFVVCSVHMLDGSFRDGSEIILRRNAATVETAVVC